MQAIEVDTTVDVIGADGKIRGTDTDARRIAALVDGGMHLDEILQDYPGLTGSQIAAAVAYGKAHSEQDREFPSQTVKSVLRRGRGSLAAAFSAADEE